MIFNRRTVWPMLVGAVGILAVGVGCPIAAGRWLDMGVWWWVSFVGCVMGAITVFIACASWYEVVRETRPTGQRRAPTPTWKQLFGRRGGRGRSRREQADHERSLLGATYAYANDPMTDPGHLHHWDEDGICDCGEHKPEGWDDPPADEIGVGHMHTDGEPFDLLAHVEAEHPDIHLGHPSEVIIAEHREAHAEDVGCEHPNWILVRDPGDVHYVCGACGEEAYSLKEIVSKGEEN